MSQIPITREYAETVGEWCEKVENRSLLHEKFAFPKNWGDSVKEDKASNWSLMRIASNGSNLLRQAQQRLANPGPKVQEPKASDMKAASKVCAALSSTKVGSGLESIRPEHSVRFIELLRKNYSEKKLRVVEGRLEGRLAINLAEGVIQNAGINLDRIFGLPLIPGSAVKGVTRSVALDELKEKNNVVTLDKFIRVFGVGKSEFNGDGELSEFASLLEKTTLPRDSQGNICREMKGAITFLQSTPTNEAKIVVDITNVHTPDYYRTGNVADLKNEKPNPNYFPAVERGAEFSFPLLLNSMSSDTALLDAAELWLKIALAQHGIGAKTAAGYGWFSDIGTEKKAKEEEHQRELKKKAAIQSTLPNPDVVARLSKWDEGNLRGLINKFVAAPNFWTTPEEEQRALLEVPRALELWGKEKGNPKSKITRGLSALADKFGVKLP